MVLKTCFIVKLVVKSTLLLGSYFLETSKFFIVDSIKSYLEMIPRATTAKDTIVLKWWILFNVIKSIAS